MDPFLMSELRNYLRMGSMFNPDKREEDELEDFNPTARMQQLYNPETRMSDRYMTALDQFPTRRSPGRMDKIAASFAALTQDPRKVEHSLYGNYERQLGDWQNQVKPLAEAAGLERQNNNNMRAIANQILSQEMGDRRLQRQISRDNVLARQGERRLTTAEQGLTLRERTADDNARRADARLKIAEKVAKGGVLDVDDAGNARIVYKDGTTEEVDGSYLSFQEKERARASNRVGSRDRVTKEVRINPVTGKPELGSFNLDTGVFTPAKDESQAPVTPGSRPTTESTATRELGNTRKVLNRANRLKANDPELGRFIVIKNGRFEGVKSGILGMGGPNEEQRKRLSKALYDDENALDSESSSQREDGKVHVRRKADGKTGWVTNPDMTKYEVIP